MPDTVTFVDGQTNHPPHSQSLSDRNSSSSMEIPATEPFDTEDQTYQNITTTSPTSGVSRSELCQPAAQEQGDDLSFPNRYTSPSIQRDSFSQSNCLYSNATHNQESPFGLDDQISPTYLPLDVADAQHRTPEFEYGLMRRFSEATAKW